MSPQVNTLDEVFALIHEHHQEIMKLGVVRLGVFGSFARNEATPSSDIDFFVEFDPEKKSFDNFMDLALLLEHYSGRKVELVTPQSLSRHIGPFILKEVKYAPLAA